VAETVIRNSGFPALPATRCRPAALEICVLMKRVGARIQARIHARENGFRHGKICRVRALEERCFQRWECGGLHSVMAGLVSAIHDLLLNTKNVDARDEPGHDDVSQ
jgi:hypothetical protein